MPNNMPGQPAPMTPGVVNNPNTTMPGYNGNGYLGNGNGNGYYGNQYNQGNGFNAPGGYYRNGQSRLGCANTNSLYWTRMPQQNYQYNNPNGIPPNANTITPPGGNSIAPNGNMNGNPPTTGGQP